MAARKRKYDQNMGAGREPSRKLKGGKRSRREKRYGKRDTNFWRWYHRVWKQKSKLGRRDGNRQEIDEAYEAWCADGQPVVK